MNKAEKELVSFAAAFLLPPLAAYWKVGKDKHFYINLVLAAGLLLTPISLLFLLSFAAAVFHALWLVLPEKANKKPVRERPGNAKVGKKRRNKKSRR